MYYLYTIVISFILNVTVQMTQHSAPLETSECFMIGKIWARIYVFGNIGKSNIPYIVDLILYPLGHFSFIIFVVGCTLFRWADNSMKFPVHTESATAEFSSFVSCVFFVVGAQARLLHTYLFSSPL